MTKLNGQSEDILQDNIAAVRELFPEVCCEGKIDFDKLRQVLGEYVDDDKERYNFTWNGKGKALRLSQTPSMGTLRPCKEESKNWDTTQNLYIEGDNLEVLKLLQKSYHGRIKMIYIDPPYNTGNDFVYPDDFSDSLENYKKLTGQVDDEGNKVSTNSEANGRYHTDWLNMMYPRLRLARNLLTDDGVIFISIDDNEIDNLHKICSEIFGEFNFIGLLSVENNPKGRKNSAFISVSSEYCLVYAKNKVNSHFIENIPKKASDMSLDENGKYVHASGKRVLVGENSFNNVVIKPDSEKNYSVYYRENDQSLILKKEEYGIDEHQLILDGYVKYYSHNKGQLVENTYSEIKFRELFQNGALDFSDGKIYEKNFSDTIRIKSQLVNREYEAIVHGKKQSYSMELTTTGAGTYIKNLFNVSESPFSAPKNAGFLKVLISLFEKGPFTVLDFFSGSATTADSVMQLNAEDGGNRKFICVQLPEPCDEKSEAFKSGYKNICEIGKERIRRAGEKIKAEVEEQNAQMKLGEEPKEVPDIGFKDFKLDTSNLRKWQPDYDDLETSLFDSISNYVDGRTELDVVYEIMLKMGLDLTWPVETHSIGGKNVYAIGMGALMICLDDDITTAVADGMVALYKELAPETWKVVFKDNGFKDDSAKTNIHEILKCAGLDEDAFTTV
ncbi:site-specific DNA-methyltransferase [Pygmaiobacter massiliensis]|uniref:site-specific DNA-methyltransferase n=1 Tax=Pygmaiobacter massiliensis TaxID=1917873 RepID=UPI002A806F17|nr:site-specific DNA-methyltransferase [Pygmaiobacter massiliensis]MDY4785096.1 site-specific DNA-methyltransferase [Pygmaiobacter massiliensis]